MFVRLHHNEIFCKKRGRNEPGNASTGRVCDARSGARASSCARSGACGQWAQHRRQNSGEAPEALAGHHGRRHAGAV